MLRGIPLISSVPFRISVLRRPLAAAGLSLAFVAVSGAGYAVSAEPSAAPATAALSTQEAAGITDAAAGAQGRRLAAEGAELQRAAEERKHEEYRVWAEAERARKAEEARKAAEEEARRAAEAAAEAERRAEAERASRSAGRDPRGAARAMVAERGWGAEQFDCLDSLWQKESNWSTTADNPTSSAYGIPQALPGSKMASAGPDWQTNARTQIAWGLGYIADRYGSPCAAWSHSKANNWY